jgi:hypothetical protein
MLHLRYVEVSMGVTLEIPEAEAVTLEAALDEALAALRAVEEDSEREERLARLHAETQVLMEQIRAELHVEKAL